MRENDRRAAHSEARRRKRQRERLPLILAISCVAFVLAAAWLALRGRAEDDGITQTTEWQAADAADAAQDLKGAVPAASGDAEISGDGNSPGGETSGDGGIPGTAGSSGGGSSGGEASDDGGSSGDGSLGGGISGDGGGSSGEASGDGGGSGGEASGDAEISGNGAVLAEAKLLAAGYDYDGAIELLEGVPGYEADEEIVRAVEEYEEERASCVAVDVTTVPHIFYHSLLNDTDSAFNVQALGQRAVDGMNAWMATVEEFDKITQQMYDNGYVLVRLRDLVTETVDESGQPHFSPNTELMLPPGKKAVVLSVDDLSYYHSYEAAGFPDRLVLDEDGKVKCHYVKPDGTEEVGDFDVVPRLNTFLEQHPDGAYKGARGIIAMTGYNGVFGYRTDIDYKVREKLKDDQKDWLARHPDFDWDEEVAEAKEIAEAIKESGWEFASHTWGHLSVTDKSVGALQADNERWVANVENIVGPVDTIIFAHGNDIGDWTDYSEDNEKYRYYKSVGYHFFCNVDSSRPYWMQIRDGYVRQARINIDGYQLYKACQGQTAVLDGMFSAEDVFDGRRPVPVTANGKE